jgi:hypothetical protein
MVLLQPDLKIISIPGGTLKEISPWALAATIITLGMVYVTCLNGIWVALEKTTWRLMWTLLFLVGLVSAIALTFPIVLVFFGS